MAKQVRQSKQAGDLIKWSIQAELRERRAAEEAADKAKAEAEMGGGKGGMPGGKGGGMGGKGGIPPEVTLLL